MLSALRERLVMRLPTKQQWTTAEVERCKEGEALYLRWERLIRKRARVSEIANAKRDYYYHNSRCSTCKIA